MIVSTYHTGAGLNPGRPAWTMLTVERVSTAARGSGEERSRDRAAMQRRKREMHRQEEEEGEEGGGGKGRGRLGPQRDQARLSPVSPLLGGAGPWFVFGHELTCLVTNFVTRTGEGWPLPLGGHDDVEPRSDAVPVQAQAEAGSSFRKRDEQ